MIPNEFLSKSFHKFYCNSCNFKTVRNSQFKIHCLTSKHKILTNPNNAISYIKMQKEKDIICNCGKKYKHVSSLCAHKKKCTYQPETEPETETEIQINNSNPISNDVIVELLKQNNEFKELLMDQNKQNIELQKQLLEMAKEGKHITTNNNNNKFNLNFFLHEQCKDAMNITDFVNSLQLQISDLENVGERGYAEGISKIFINGLKQLDIFKRPIHCSDIKRETMYIKDKDAWEKENQEKAKILWAIKNIAHKNVKQIPEWQDENPEYKDGQSNIHEQFLKIVSESMGGHNDEEDNANYNKIIRNIAKEVIIER